MPGHVHLRLERRLVQDPSTAYAWFTDFEEGDPQRTGAVLERRRIVERAPGRIVYEGEQVVLGRRTHGTTEVTLHPPDRWEAKVTNGPRTGSFTHYRIIPHETGSHLTVDYHIILDDAGRQLLLRIAKPLVKRELGKMWDGFEAAMQRELAPQHKA